MSDIKRALDRLNRKASQLKDLAEEVGELEAKQRDISTLDMHVRTLSGGSYWYSNDDTCGVNDASDAALEDGEQPRSWHRHGSSETHARRLAAEYVRSLVKGALDDAINLPA